MSIFSRIRPPQDREQVKRPEPSASDFLRSIVEHTEEFPIGSAAARLDKNIGGHWSVELSDGRYIMLETLAKCYMAHNPKDQVPMYIRRRL